MRIKTFLTISTIFLFFFTVKNLQGQNNTCSITGTVIDNYSKTPLFYANIGLMNAKDSTFIEHTFTDASGKFKLPNVKTGEYLLKIFYSGYDMFQQSLSVTDGKTEIATDTIKLQPVATTLEGITIAAAKPVYTTDGEKTLYNVSEDPSIQTGTASDALQNSPGVEVDIEGNITLRGVSSVEIWINDKPSQLNAENLKTYLQQLPANSLERIEVITNPSAQYGAQGTGGIINIVTKSNIKQNTLTSFGVNVSTKPMVSPWFSYMFSNQKLSLNLYVHGNYQYSNNKSNGNSIMLNENKDTSSYRSYNSQSNSNAISTGVSFNGSYTFDTMNIISFWSGVHGTPFSKSRSFSDYQYEEFITNPGVYDYTQESASTYLGINANIGTWYEHKFNNKGHKISATARANYSQSHQNNPYSRLYSNYTDLNINRKNNRDNQGSSVYAGVNYSFPYSEKGEITAGVSGDFGTELLYWRNDTLLPVLNTYVLDSMRFEDYAGKSGNLDGYATVRQKFGQFTVKGGLRIQNRFLGCKIINQPEHHGNQYYLGFFPSLHLSYATKSMHNMTLSYTRRINYPQNSQLTTFITNNDDSYSTGNENLRPTYTNSIEAGWTKFFKKFGSVGLSAYFRNSKDEINNLTDVVYNDYFGRYVNFSMPVNSGKSHRYGADANVVYRLKAFMNIRFNAGIYQSHSETVFREDTIISTNAFTYNFQLNFWAKMWKFLEVTVSGNYRSKTKSLFREEQPVYSLNCGLRSDFWDRKISVYLNVQDIFNWNKQRNNNTNPYYIAYNSSKQNSRFISAGVTFRFGKIEMEKHTKKGEEEVE